MKKFMSVVMTAAMLMAMSATVLAGGVTVPGIGNPAAKSTGLGNIAANALGLVQWFGYAIAVGMLLYIGIKYMMASANEKADLKKGAISYVIGAILVAAASAIVGVVVDIGAGITQQ